MSPVVRPMTRGRWALAAGLGLFIFLLGMQSDAVFALLTQAWQWAFNLIGLGGVLAHLQQGTSSLVTTRSLPAMATYGLLYVGLCVLLLATGRLSGQADWAYKLGRRIIDFMVSPLPVMILLPLLWPGHWANAPQAPKDGNSDGRSREL